MIAENHILPGHEIHDQTFGLPILWHMGDAAIAPRLTIGMRAGQVDLVAIHSDGAGRGLVAAQNLQQFRLAVAGHARNAQYLARLHLK